MNKDVGLVQLGRANEVLSDVASRLASCLTATSVALVASTGRGTPGRTTPITAYSQHPSGEYGHRSLKYQLRVSLRDFKVSAGSSSFWRDIRYRRLSEADSVGTLR